MTEAQKAYDFITGKIAEGFTVMVATNLKATQITPKTFAKFEAANHPLFKIGEDGCLYMASGKGYVCIAYKDMILTRISAF